MALLRWLTPGDQPGRIDVDPLTPEAAARLRPSLFARCSSSDLARRVRLNPDLAFVVRNQNHYAIGAHWRRRGEIGEVTEVSRGPYRRQLLQRLLGALDAKGVALVIVDFDEAGNDGGFYVDEGFAPVDRIVEYERRGCWVDRPPASVPLRSYRPEDVDVVLEIERESFPWLWWNSRAELEHYYRMPEVELHLGLDGDAPVGYAGITIRGTAGHIDRLAVRRSHQRRGYGAAMLVHALERMGRAGVRRVTLSTQEDNVKSQALYQRYGFQRGRWTYDIRGLWLREPPETKS